MLSPFLYFALTLQSTVAKDMRRLCHIVHGPHDEHFHRLWDQLRDEHEALLRKGYTGEGFLSTGHKLGGQRIPIHEARRRARAAAELRRAQSAGSGQRLGGRAVSRGTDIRRVIADAAQRRTAISKGCDSVGEDEGRKAAIVAEAGRNGFRTKAEEDDANARAIEQAYIELLQEEEREKWGKGYVPASGENPAGSQGQAPPVPTHSKPRREPARPEDTIQRKRRPVNFEPNDTVKLEPDDDVKLEPENAVKLEPDDAMVDEMDSELWSCPVCTLNNEMQYLSCDACGVERPPIYNKDLDPPKPPSWPTPTSSSSKNPRPVTIKPTSTSSNPSPAPKALPRSRSAPLSAGARAAEERAAAQRRKQSGLRNLASLYSAEEERPLGWLCTNCRNFMEREWWTCANCGAMKQSS